MNDEWPNESSVALPGGWELRCPAYPEECSYVRILNRDGREVGYWNEDEWRLDPAEVMGAIVGAMKGGEDRGTT